jgi:hypothetical protein
MPPAVRHALWWLAGVATGVLSLIAVQHHRRPLIAEVDCPICGRTFSCDPNEVEVGITYHEEFDCEEPL